MSAGRLPFLRADGGWFVTESGERVILRGCNLGNWLMIEPWMLGLWGRGIDDQHALEQVLEKRFGPDERVRLMELYRANWIRPLDFEIIRSFGMNVVRLPFYCALLEDEHAPMRLRPDAFRWLDRALEMAEQAGIYVILDMHGAPGGQSYYGHTGQGGRNALWESPQCQQRTVWLWQRIAERYANRPVVAAYDLINEPYGANAQQNAELQAAIVRAIREVDPRHVVLMSATLEGPGSLAANLRAVGSDRANLGLTAHFYPGLFGDDPAAVERHLALLRWVLPVYEACAAQARVAFLVGEFNVVFARCGGPEMMRLYYDEFARRGWAATMWSYKITKPQPGIAPDAWYMVTNAEPLPPPDFSRAPLEEIEGYFRRLGTVPYALREGLRKALTAPEGRLSLAAFEASQGRLRTVEAEALRDLKGEYFSNANLSGTPALVRHDEVISFDWGRGAPAQGIAEDGFSVRWTGTLTVPRAGLLRIGVHSDDGCRLWLDDRLVLDNWRDQPANTNTVLVEIGQAGPHRLRLEYYENQGEAVARLVWDPEFAAAAR